MSKKKNNQKTQDSTSETNIIKPCENCGVQVTRWASQYKRSRANRVFCSKSCAATYNNKITPKRKKKVRCCSHKDCSNLVWKDRSTLCEEHHKGIYGWHDKSLKAYRAAKAAKGQHPSWFNSQIRAFARSHNKDLILLPCANCGYGKHVELCHRIAITAFPEETPLKQVNARSNLIQLCRNCHWEFDNGLLAI